MSAFRNGGDVGAALTGAAAAAGDGVIADKGSPAVKLNRAGRVAASVSPGL